ncbi:MAG: hypothetical protein AB7P03_09285 [Kofleriaceae bacterium]
MTRIHRRSRSPLRSWGGARQGAGRPASGPIASEPHKPRPSLVGGYPIHIVARVVPAVGSLVAARARRAIDIAVVKSLARDDFQIVHVDVIASRIELIVEARNKAALARGMQGFQVSAARQLNAAAARRGTVFPDRYRAEPLRTARAVAELTRLRSSARISWPRARVLRGSRTKR